MNRLLAIVGPTASGKSDLAMCVARQFGGEIICADSRTIYCGMDIGTAKPNKADQAEVPHHLLDLINPGETFSAADFKTRAFKAISQIEARGNLPILVGGSGLYTYAVLYDYQFPAGANNHLRQQLQQLSIDQLVERLQALDPETAATIDLKNPRRVVRAIETAGQSKASHKLRPDTVLVGLRPDQAALDVRIANRTEAMIKDGLITETKQLINQYGLDLEALKSPGYLEASQFIAGEIKEGEVKDLINLHTRQLTKRQITWFKRNPDIQWYESNEAAGEFISQQLKFKRV